jgi:hypothetical protein
MIRINILEKLIDRKKIIFNLIAALCLLFSIFCYYPWRPVYAWDFLENSGVKQTAQGMGFGDEDDIAFEEKAGQILGYLMSFLGVIFLCLLLYGGWIWMNSRGSENEVEKAKNVITSAIIGLIIIIFSYAITIFIKQIFIKST